MNWPLLQQSLLLALAVAGFAVLLGTACAIAASTSKRSRLIEVFAAIALTLPPFMVANTWMHFFGLAGAWRRYVDFDLYSWPGAIFMMTMLIWPVAFFLARAALSKLESERLEADPLLSGWKLARWVLLPHLKSTLATSFVISFVFALNHFSIPALLQTKVYSADVWVAFNTTFDYVEALRIGWPLIAAPILLLLLVRGGTDLWPSRNLVDATRLRAGLGVLRLPTKLVAYAAIALSLFPLGHLLLSSSGWTQIGSAAAAGKSAIVSSLIVSFGGATIAVAGALIFSKRSWAIAAWLPFLIPGVVLGIAIIRVFNQPGLAWFYPSFGLVIAALSVRYFALPLQALSIARRRIDQDILRAARADGASFFKAFSRAELPLLAAPMFSAWYLAYLFCLWDAETMVMIVPPGGETLSLRVFNMLHYGHTEQVNALCLWLIALALAPLAGWFVFNHRKSIAIGAIFLAGCGEAPNGTRVQSELFSHVQILGRRGNGAGEFNKPRSVAVDAQDNLYVADMTGRVQKFTPDGTYLLSWHMEKTDLGKPKGMIQNLDGSIIVVEPHYNRLNYHQTNGTLALRWGTKGTNDGELAFPRSVGVNSAGEVYVSEYGLVERIQRFSPRGERLLGVFGAGGEGEAEFRRAEGLGIDGKDRVYVADSCNHRIQVFSREGKFLRQHGSAGSGSGQMSYPYDVRVDRKGYEFVCEFGNSRVQIFDPEGRSLEIVGGAGGEPGKMNNPWSICLDSKGNLYVADSQNHRVQKFIRKGGGA